MDEVRFEGKFFEPLEGYPINECDQTGLMNLNSYSQNYYYAAVTLVSCSQEDRLLTSYVGHPVAFLYRQYIELMLKDLINLLGRLESDGFGYPKSHDLDKLWGDAKKRIERHYREGQMPDGIHYADQCVGEFHKLDSASDAFRYPHSTKGKEFQPTRFHVLRLGAGMHEVDQFLSTVRGDLYHKWQNSPE